MSAADLNDWNRIADAYAASSGAESRIYAQFKDVLWKLLGELSGRDVLDLGCGDGWFSALLRSAGANVVGIDGSQELIVKARARYPGIEFIEQDLAAGLPDSPRRFDRIVAHMVLMDIPELTHLLRSVRTALKPAGRFILTMPHPCFFNMKSHRDESGALYRKVTGYLQPEVWRIDTFGGHNHYHRSLTYYFDALAGSGMAVTRLFEPPHIPGPDRTGADRAYFESIPVFILMEAAPIAAAKEPA
jgi:SAM-dependent methyltransferase